MGIAKPPVNASEECSSAVGRANGTNRRLPEDALPSPFAHDGISQGEWDSTPGGVFN